MKTQKYIFLTITILLVALCPVVWATELPPPFALLPQPREVELLHGDGLELGGLHAVHLGENVERPIMGELLSPLPQTERSGNGVLTLQLAGDDFAVQSPEGYVLEISGSRVRITSPGQAGLFYGCQTLEQLLQDARDARVVIPACRIVDYPAMAYRAVHFDVKHHLDHQNYYYDAIDRLARYKINAIVFEFEDKLRYRRQPVVGGPLSITIEEMAALTQYARKRHIEITPLVQGLGHATFILKHPQYKNLREQPENRWAFCPMDEGTYKVLFDLYLDAMQATPGSRYLHIGGDEVGQIGTCPRCKDMAEKEGVFGLNMYWLNRVTRFVQEHGRIPMFWDDMPLKFAGVFKTTYKEEIDSATVEALWEKGLPILNEQLDKFPKNCIYMRWAYSRPLLPGNQKAVQWYKNSGLKVVAATATQNRTPLLPYAGGPEQKVVDDRVIHIREFIRLAAENQLQGMLCTAWDDASPHMETYWRGFMAAAEYSWNPDGRSLQEFESAFLQRMFGPLKVDATGLYRDLFESANFWFQALPVEIEDVPSMEHQAVSGDVIKREYDPAVVLPLLSSLGEWSNRYRHRLDEARQAMIRYQRSREMLHALQQQARRNRYHLRMLAAINEFQATAPRLLLALQQADVPDVDKQRDGLRRVQQALDSFEGAWDRLKTVFAETRFLAYPPEFIPDRYRHFASRREDISFLIQKEQIYHPLVRRWLAQQGVE